MANDFFGKGIAFPVRPLSGGGLLLAAGEAKVQQSVWLILATAPGERLMRPDFGCGIHDLVFEPNTSAQRELVAVKVREALVKWELRIDVLDVVSETSPDRRNRLMIQIDYRLRANNAFNNMVYPFFLHDEAVEEAGRAA